MAKTVKTVGIKIVKSTIAEEVEVEVAALLKCKLDVNGVQYKLHGALSVTHASYRTPGHGGMAYYAPLFVQSLRIQHRE